MDFHGNNVHQVGYRHPRVVARGEGSARHAAVLAAPLHQRLRDRAGGAPGRAGARPARQGAVRARRHARDRHGAQARARRDRPPQDDLAVGQLPRRLARRDLDRRRSGVPQGHRPAAAGHRARAALRPARLPLRLRRQLQHALRRVHRVHARQGAGRRGGHRRDGALHRRADSAARLLPRSCATPATGTARC